MDIREIVSAHLREAGAGGLRNDLHGCSCVAGDLMPEEGCVHSLDACRPGVQLECPDCGHAFVVVPRGPE